MRRAGLVVMLVVALCACTSQNGPTPGDIPTLPPDGPVARYAPGVPTDEMQASLEGTLTMLDGCVVVLMTPSGDPVVPVFPEPTSWDPATEAVQVGEHTLPIGTAVSLGGGYVEGPYGLPEGCPLVTFEVSTVAN